MRTYILQRKCDRMVQGVLVGPDTDAINPMKELTIEFCKTKGVSIAERTLKFSEFVEWLKAEKGFTAAVNPTVWSFKAHWFGVEPVVKTSISDDAAEAPDVTVIALPPPVPESQTIPEGGPDDDEDEGSGSED
jgi:hypothetical protein